MKPIIATAGVGFLLRRDEEDQLPGKTEETPREASELLGSGSMLLFPLLMLFGVYIFLHGHLTPGGGFQGGVVIASAMLLLMLARVSFHLNHLIISLVESLSGFLDNRILPLGEFGTLFSASAIPIIYSLVGLKVGTELTNVLDTMRLTRTQQEGDV